jgi:hypothetical protein
MATSDSIPYCAYCAQPKRERRLYIHFPLLASVARDACIALKLPGSDYFHAPCGRRVYRQLLALDVELVPGARNYDREGI